MKLYHLTLLENLDSIKKNGLLPKIGKNSFDFGESVPAIYLFKDLISLEDALSNWLGDCFEEDMELVVLEVDVLEDILENNNEFEIKILTAISPEKIFVLKTI